MAVNVRREGILDYILAGGAGIAKGVQTGLEQRKEAERKAAVQKALDDYRTATLGIQERGLDIEEEGQKLLTRQRMQQNAATMLMPWLQDRFMRKQIKARGKEERKTLEFKAGLPSIGKDLLDIQEQQVKIRGMETDVLLGESLIKQRGDITALNEQKFLFEQEKETTDNVQFRIEMMAEAAKTIFTAETAAEMTRFKALTDEWLKQGDLSGASMFAMKSKNFWEYMAATAETDAEKQAAVGQIQQADKTLVEMLKKFDQIEYKPAQVTYEKKIWRADKVGFEGQPSLTLPERGARPALAEPQGRGFMDKILGFMGEQQAPAEQAALPQFTEPIGLPDPFRATSEEKQEVIDRFKTAKIKKLNAETIRRLEIGGFTPEDIAEIKKAIK